MAYEKQEQRSKGYSLYEEWVSLELIGEITVLPVEILGDLVEAPFGL